MIGGKKLIGTFNDLLNYASELKGRRIALAFANNRETLLAVIHAKKRFSAEFILTGDNDFILNELKELGENLSSIEIIHCPEPTLATRTAIEYASNNKADVLLKGGIDTSTLMKLVFDEKYKFRKGNLLSDVFIFEYPERAENKLVMITDGGLILNPSLNQKIEIINNAVAVAHALGNLNPKVAILSSSEFVNPKLQSSVDAEIIAGMNRNGEISGCCIDGPLALDSAMIPESAREKKINSPVAGNAEILIAPNIETANALAKSTTYFAHYRLAHVIIGAKVPILITSRADKSDAKLLSIALGIIMSETRKRLTKK